MRRIVAGIAVFVILLGGPGAQAQPAQAAQPAAALSPAVQVVLRPLTGIMAVATGGFHTCALTTGGGVRCWGDNSFGQLGNGQSGLGTVSTTPVAVVGLGGGVKQIVAGLYHTCALKLDGAVVCWGSNSYGQLGDGRQFSDSAAPVGVVELSPSAAIAAGFHHTCSLMAGGAVECWGDNASGQLGDTNRGEPKARPVSVFGLPGATGAISAGGDHTCARLTDGAAFCWGDNSRGQLGDGQHGQDSDFPVAVVGLGSGVETVDAGAYHTCASTGGAGAVCWGANESGQVGNGSHAADEDTPQAVVGLGAGGQAVAAGGDDSVGFTCALTSQAGTHCWGANNYGQLGNGAAGPGADSDVPVQVARLGGAVQMVDAGGFHACAVTGAGGVWCWGDNRFGQLGDGTRASRSVPAAVREEVLCYALTLGYSGGGTVPAAAPGHSAICPAGHYLAGEAIALGAQSAPGWRIHSWQGTDDDERTEATNAVEMPAADHAVTVVYTLAQSAAVYLPAMH